MKDELGTPEQHILDSSAPRNLVVVLASPSSLLTQGLAPSLGWTCITWWLLLPVLLRLFAPKVSDLGCLLPLGNSFWIFWRQSCPVLCLEWNSESLRHWKDYDTVRIGYIPCCLMWGKNVSCLSFKWSSLNHGLLGSLNASSWKGPQREGQHWIQWMLLWKYLNLSSCPHWLR